MSSIIFSIFDTDLEGRVENFCRCCMQIPCQTFINYFTSGPRLAKSMPKIDARFTGVVKTWPLEGGC